MYSSFFLEKYRTIVSMLLRLNTNAERQKKLTRIAHALCMCACIKYVLADRGRCQPPPRTPGQPVPAGRQAGTVGLTSAALYHLHTMLCPHKLSVLYNFFNIVRYLCKE